MPDEHPTPAAAGDAPRADRLDRELARRGLAASRNQAAGLIAAGAVTVDGVTALRAALQVSPAASVIVHGPQWVSRAALKLVAALDAFGVEVRHAVALDLGASTGGFSQVLLRRGAARVVALDVGEGQLVDAVRHDPRVVVIEHENARYLTAERLAALSGVGAPPSIVTADLSFISLTQVLPAIAAVIAPRGSAVVLIKPQFEVGRSFVKGGLVKDVAVRDAARDRVIAAAGALGFESAGLIPSPIRGSAGNVEFLAHLVAAESSVDPTEWARWRTTSGGPA